MRLMPSDTVTTVPCVRTSAPVSRFWILLLISSLISDGFNCMIFSSRVSASVSAGVASVSTSGSQMGRHRLQFAPHRSVDDGVADDDSRAADQIGVHAHGCLDLLAKPLFKRGFERRKLAVGDWKRTRDVSARDAIGGVLQRIENLMD